MIINRIRAAPGGPPGGGDGEVPYGDFVVVSGPFGRLCVTRAVAREIERALDARWPPRWVAFRDRVGSRIRLRTCDVRALVESTAAQRAGDRLLERARLLEEAADGRAWEDGF